MDKITDTDRRVVKDSKTAVDVTVEMVLSELPQKTLMNYVPMVLLALDLPKDLTVLRPLHLLLNDVAVLSQSPFSTAGCTMVISEQPVNDYCMVMGRLMMGGDGVGDDHGHGEHEMQRQLDGSEQAGGRGRDNGQSDAAAGHHGERR